MQTSAITDLLQFIDGISWLIPIILIIACIIYTIKIFKKGNNKIKWYFLVFLPLILMFWLIWWNSETEKHMLQIQIVFMVFYINLLEKYRNKK